MSSIGSRSRRPDTLLLAEAFWLLEGYFVRTLGMHRVYNSAFMNMLRDEKNAEYRQVMKNTLEFDPAILGRFVNFMSNPDEKTAVEQFGTGDKYFGVAAMLATLPGLPMLGHGQAEGFREQYGMEFRRARLDERVDEGLLAHHERTIFPLLHRRPEFAGSDALPAVRLRGRARRGERGRLSPTRTAARPASARWSSSTIATPRSAGAARLSSSFARTRAGWREAAGPDDDRRGPRADPAAGRWLVPARRDDRPRGAPVHGRDRRRRLCRRPAGLRLPGLRRPARGRRRAGRTVVTPRRAARRSAPFRASRTRSPTWSSNPSTSASGPVLRSALAGPDRPAWRGRSPPWPARRAASMSTGCASGRVIPSAWPRRACPTADLDRAVRRRAAPLAVAAGDPAAVGLGDQAVRAWFADPDAQGCPRRPRLGGASSTSNARPGCSGWRRRRGRRTARLGCGRRAPRPERLADRRLPASTGSSNRARRLGPRRVVQDQPAEERRGERPVAHHRLEMAALVEAGRRARSRPGSGARRRRRRPRARRAVGGRRAPAPRGPSSRRSRSTAGSTRGAPGCTCCAPRPLPGSRRRPSALTASSSVIGPPKASPAWIRTSMIALRAARR